MAPKELLFQSRVEESLFHEISLSGTFMGALMRNLGLVQTFSLLHVELRLCIQRDTTPVAGGKKLPTNKNWWNHGKSLIFRRILPQILRFTCHATCPLAQEYYSPRGRAVSTSHIGNPVRAPALRKQSDFAFLRALRGSEIALFHEISSSDTSMGALMRNLGPLQTFSLSYASS